MILKMHKGVINVEQFPAPIICNKIFVRYLFERNTNHLIPHLYINGELKAIGENKFITMNSTEKEVTMKIILVDAQGNTVKTYAGTFAYHTYCIIGNKPVRQDMEDYVHSLEQRIKELEELGEVI
jgi:hypothetical protein